MMEVQDQGEKKLSKIAFYIAANGILGDAPFRRWLDMLEQKMVTDAEGNLPPDIIGAIYIMLHAAPGTGYVHTSELLTIRKMKEFLDPYLEERYRPTTEEPAPAIYLAWDRYQ